MGGGGASPDPTGVTPSGGSGGSAEAGGSSGSGGSAGSAGNDGPARSSLPSFLLGADISSVQEAVDRGARYIDTDGREKPILELLKNHGFNTIRLRTFVDPSADYGYAAGTGDCDAKAEPYADKAHTIEFAREIVAAGMSFLLDLHYSDTWADPGKQIIPSAWRGAANISELASFVHDYTIDIVSSLADAGAKPDMVQVGNETTPGMLIHVPGANTDCWGNNSVAHRFGGSTSNWDALAELLKAGIAGVRAVDPEIKVMLHLESTDDLAATRWWVQSAVSRGVEFDVLGLSCYTQWQGSPAVWRNTFTTLANEFPQLSFVIAEYNPERTAANQVMLDLPDGRGLGTFFWEPTQSGEWGQSMFTYSGNTLQARPEDFAEYDQLRSTLGL